MKNIKILLLAGLLMIAACQSDADQSVTPAEEETKELPEMSVYQLPGIWTNQDNEDFPLEELRGKVTVMVMIYTSCKAACPRLVADMRRIEEQIPEQYKPEVQYVMVSIDPEVDTPEKMKEFSIENEMTDDKWIFVRSTEENTREFATVLAVNYKRISPIDFSHSNIISVFDKDGVMKYQQEGLDLKHEKTIRTIKELAGAKS